ncbi:hypothetical protein Hanom_Chr09g00796971 [Helianthus anomalus]
MHSFVEGDGFCGGNDCELLDDSACITLSSLSSNVEVIEVFLLVEREEKTFLDFFLLVKLFSEKIGSWSSLDTFISSLSPLPSINSSSLLIMFAKSEGVLVLSPTATQSRNKGS